MKTKLVVVLLFCLFLTSNAIAVPYALSGSTTSPAAGADVFAGAGDFHFTFTVDPDTNRITGAINFSPNASGSLANFFFLSLTSGDLPVPGSNETARIVFDMSQGGAPIVSVYEYVAFDGTTDPLINVFSGNMLFTSLNGDPQVISSAATVTATSATYTFEIDSSLFPGTSFENFGGIWLQTMGLFPADGTFVTYGAGNRIVDINADIDSRGSYGYYDGSFLPTSAVPEPASVLLLSGALGLLGVRRKK